MSVGNGGIEEQRPEDYVIAGLIDFDDISYDNADLLDDLATQTVEHFGSYLGDEADLRRLRGGVQGAGVKQRIEPSDS